MIYVIAELSDFINIAEINYSELFRMMFWFILSYAKENIMELLNVPKIYGMIL